MLIAPDIIAALRALGFCCGWAQEFVPSWKDLEELTEPERLETVDADTVCDATLEYLRFTPNVIVLDLMSTRVTDDGLRALRHVPKLEELWLNNTAVGDEGVQHLASHQRLKRVVAHNSHMTIAGERWLRSAIPGCAATIGRRALNGRVAAVDGEAFVVEPMGIHFGKWTAVDSPLRAIVREEDRARLAEFLAAPIGRMIRGIRGEADEPNVIHDIRE